MGTHHRKRGKHSSNFAPGRISAGIALAVSIQFQVHAAPIAFSAALDVPVAGTGIGSRIIAGDFNNDGHPDLVTTPNPQGPESYPNVDGINVLYGDGTGGFPETRTFLGGESLSGISSADFNGDGRLDLVTTESFGAQPVAVGLCGSRFARAPVFLGAAMGGFAANGCLSAADHPGAVVAAEFDGDGIPDLVIVNSSRYSSDAASRNASFFKGIGDGTFESGLAFGADHADDIVAADFNGDGIMDFAIASPSYTHIYLGAGNGSFTALGVGIAGSTRRIAVGDINGDSFLDIAMIGSSPIELKDDLVRIAYGNGDGSFKPASTLAAGEHPTGIALADLNRDGYADVIVANHLSDDISVYVSVDGQSFPLEQRIAAGNGPMGLAVADFTGDGIADIAIASNNPESDGTLGDGSVRLLVTAASDPGTGSGGTGAGTGGDTSGGTGTGAVPEPPAYAMLLAGLGLMVLARRRGAAGFRGAREEPPGAAARGISDTMRTMGRLSFRPVVDGS